MRHLLRSGLLTAVGLAAAAPVAVVVPTATAAGSACTAPGACVVIHLAGDRSGTAEVSAAQIDRWADLPPSDYRVRDTPGGGTTFEGVSRSLTLRDLLLRLRDRGGDFADLDPSAMGIVTIPRDSISYVSTLTGTGLRPAGSNGFIDGQSPVLSTPGGTDTVAYIRPLTDDPDDVNRLDVFQSDGNGALDITVSTTGTVLRPTIDVAPGAPGVGQAADLVVRVPTAPRGLTARWLFGGGGSSQDLTTTHTWSMKGTFAVSVEVRAPDGSYGRAVRRVEVGDPPPPPPAPSTPPPAAGGGGGSGSGAGASPGPAGSAGDLGAVDAPGQESAGTDAADPKGTTDTASAEPTAGAEAPAAQRDGSIGGLLLRGSDLPAPTAQASPATTSTVAPEPVDRRLPAWLLAGATLALLVLIGAATESRDLLARRLNPPTPPRETP